MRSALAALLVLAGAAAPSFAADPADREIAGVSVPGTRATAEGRKLTRIGAGIRTATLLNIKVYVAALYAPTRMPRPEALMKARPLWMDFTFLRNVDEGRGDDAWQYQFKQSVPDPYPGMEEDVLRLTAFFGPIRKFDVQSFYLDGDKTTVYVNGNVKGTISGANFQKAFMTIWVGPKPPTQALKSALLGEPR